MNDLYDYPLPKERIAQRPAARRGDSRLMVLGDGIEHRAFADFPSLLRDGDVVVVNDSRVVPARLIARRATGGRVRVLLIDRDGDRWRALLDRDVEGETLAVGDRSIGVGDRGEDGFRRVEAPADILEAGEPPLPPYIRRPDGATAEDRERYQTVYAAQDGSIAAPTAGLHFTEAMLASLPVVRITLHIGVGTFLPARERMEPERYRISPEAMARIEAARRVVAVGTSVTRALEAHARTGRLEDATDLFIRPPFEFRRVGALLTNFHLPRGTPLMLACAFAGRERLLETYAVAVREGYRFYSYGDAMLITRT